MSGIKNPHIVSEEQKKKISETLKGRPLSDEHRWAISDGLIGHSVSEETRRKISEGNKGLVKDPRTCAAISAALKGCKLPDETKAKISASLKGIVPWNDGIATGPMTPEHIRNRVNSLRTVTAEQVQAIRKENPYRGHIAWGKELGVTSTQIGKIRRYQAFPLEP